MKKEVIMNSTADLEFDPQEEQEIATEAQNEQTETGEIEFVEDERLFSILESIFFSSAKPVSLAVVKSVFKGTNIKQERVKKAIDQFMVQLAGADRGVTLEEVAGGYQLRTKLDNLKFIQRASQTKTFKISGPSLEVLSIIAYKQPLVKSEIDAIRGVESGHLVKSLMDRGLVTFEGKSELPGKPMAYGTSKKFLEVFGLRNIKELPTLSQIDELLPEGISDEDPQSKDTLNSLTDQLAQEVVKTYSENEEELGKIAEQLQAIETTSQFFEQEKEREKQKREAMRAEDIRLAIEAGEEVSTRDRNWLAARDQFLNPKAENEVSQ